MCYVESGLPDGMRDITTLKLFLLQRLHSMCLVALFVRFAMGAEFAVPGFALPLHQGGQTSGIVFRLVSFLTTQNC
jgi:hypothetical protein